MESIKRTAVFLEKNRARDKVFRTLQYSARLCVGALQSSPHAASASPLVTKLIAFSKAMSDTRITLRLLDDLPVWVRLLQGKTVRGHRYDRFFVISVRGRAYFLGRPTYCRMRSIVISITHLSTQLSISL